MSRVLADVLGISASDLSRGLAELEAAHGVESVDVAFIGRLSERSAAMHRAFRLDPTDTTAEEMYAALRIRIAEDNERMARAIGGTHPNAVSEMTPLILSFLKKYVADRHVWALKSATAKKLLKKQPPIRTMKTLNCRSVDSLMKHHSIFELMVVVRYLETPEWNAAFTALYRQLEPKDFEMRTIEVVYADKLAYIEPLELSQGRHHLVLHSKEMGAIAIAPTREKVIRGYTARTLSLSFHYCNEIVAMSGLLAALRVHKDYGTDVAAMLAADVTGHVHFGVPIHWRSVHAHSARHGRDDTSDEGVAGVTLRYTSPNDELMALAPTLKLWYGHGSVAKTGEAPVGYNIVDLSIDDAADASFEERSLKYMRRELENELIMQYLERPTIHRIVMSRLGM